MNTIFEIVAISCALACSTKLSLAKSHSPWTILYTHLSLFDSLCCSVDTEPVQIGILYRSQ